MRLLLIRHGQTSSNVIHALDTAEPGADLTELGRRQAAAVPAAIADEPIEALVVTSLVRTQQTAEPLAAARGLTPRLEPGFREISAGDLEMRNDHEAMTTYVDTVFSWSQTPERGLPGGESGHEVLARCDDVVARLAAEGLQHVAIIAHGAVIRAFAAARAHNVTPQGAAERWLRNTGMIVLEGSPQEGWTMTRWSEEPLGGAHLAGFDVDDPTGAPESQIEHGEES